MYNSRDVVGINYWDFLKTSLQTVCILNIFCNVLSYCKFSSFFASIVTLWMLKVLSFPQKLETMWISECTKGYQLYHSFFLIFKPLHMKQYWTHFHHANFYSVVKTFETPSSTTDLGKKRFKGEQCVHVYKKLQGQRRPEMLTLNLKEDMKKIKALCENIMWLVLGGYLALWPERFLQFSILQCKCYFYSPFHLERFVAFYGSLFYVFV